MNCLRFSSLSLILASILINGGCIKPKASAIAAATETKSKDITSDRSLLGDALPDAATASTEDLTKWARARLPGAEESFDATGEKRLESPTFWGKEIVYSVQVDRFNDGNLANDEKPSGSISSSRIPGLRHGGDISGITARLDYMSDLGITALWITPVFKHNGDYHGYCATDPTAIDPGFGTKEDLRDLVKQAHKLGIKVILDIVVNHLCDSNSSYAVQPVHNLCAKDLDASNWSNTPATSASQGTLKLGDTFFPPLRRQEFFNRCGGNSSGDTNSENPEAIYGDFASIMFDYNTRNTDFQAIFTDIHKWWIAYADVDGFRLDATKHVTEDYLAYFATNIRDYAKSLGKRNFYIVGEVAASADWAASRFGNMLTNPTDPSSHGKVPPSLTAAIGRLKSTYLADPNASFPGPNAIYDFTLSGDYRNYLLGKIPATSIEDDVASDGHKTLAMQSDPRLNWIVLEIHDWTRYASEAAGDLWKSKLGLSLLATVEGIPVIYYGLEQGFNARCEPSSFHAGDGDAAIRDLCGGSDDALKRQDMFINGPWRLGSTVPSINSLAYIGPGSSAPSPEWTADPMLARDHEVYQTARRFNHLRSSCSALNQGKTIFRSNAQTPSGLLIFSRLDSEKEMVIVVNNTSDPLPIPDIAIESPLKTTFRNAIYESQSAEASDNLLHFNGVKAEGNTVAVYTAEGDLEPLDAALGIRLCKGAAK